YSNPHAFSRLALQYNFVHGRKNQNKTDADMKNGAWRLDRLLSYTLVNILIALPQAAADNTDTAADFVQYYQRAYAHGRDLIPGPLPPL
ncbi:hypothetical protein ACCT20_37410, partial [Rhizobium ruizarguesonis]